MFSNWRFESLTALLTRAVQSGFALLLFFLFLPLFGLLFVVVVVDSGLPFLYRGRRVGLNGETFWIYKIRTLREGAEQQIGASHLRRDDESITRVGRFLRYSKLDELPQLCNILRGDMNFVGPRPVRPIFYDQYIESIPRYAERFRVKPGLTGLAQLEGKYESSPWEKLQYELEFIENDSAAFRLKIVFRTIGLLVMNLTSPKFSFHRSPDENPPDANTPLAQTIDGTNQPAATIAKRA